jgi:hypothetical protein
MLAQIVDLVEQRYSMLVADRVPFEAADVETLVGGSGSERGVDYESLQALHSQLQSASWSSRDRAQTDARQRTCDISSYVFKSSWSVAPTSRISFHTLEPRFRSGHSS